MSKPKLLDLYCKAGGAGYGYHLAGFEVVGVDIETQPRYPFEFVQMDALQFLSVRGHEFDVIHASPPCQFASEATPMQYRDNHPNLIEPTRDLLAKIGKPYVIENVENARRYLINPVMLCGTMFGLPLWRHRYFEIHPALPALTPPCNHKKGFISVNINGQEKRVGIPVLCTGGGDGKKASRKTHRPRQPVEEIRWAMQIGWMTQQELSNAIPPAYTKHIGGLLLANTAQLSNTACSGLVVGSASQAESNLSNYSVSLVGSPTNR